jgi:putative SOS response-associated peptidase YedK
MIAMCGRYTVFTEDEVIEMRDILSEVNQRYIGSLELSAMKTGEIFPTNVVPVLAAGAGGLEARLMTWGFPKWQGSGVIINARAETAMEKPLFRNSLERRRCIIPSTGFYEWKHEDGKTRKDKYLITLPGEEMLYMAGFYDSFTDKSGKPYAGFVILTAEANESMSPLHDRMPVILSAGQRGQWLSNPAGAAEILVRKNVTRFLLRQVPA